jgi:YVTN family beta-propeller protein
MLRGALLVALAGASGLAGCGWGGGNTPPSRPASAGDALALVPLPAQAVSVCQREQARAHFTVLCPARLPRATRALTPGTPPLPLIVHAGAGGLDFSYGGEAGPDPSVPLRRLNAPERFLHFVVGRAVQGVPWQARPTRLGGRQGLLLPATSNGSLDDTPYFGNHVRFFWRQQGTTYVATLHTFGESATERLLDRLLRELGPARALVMPARPPVREVAMFDRPAALALGAGAVWAGAMENLAAREPRLLRIDPVTLRARGLPSTGPTDVHLASGAGSLWITSAVRDRRRSSGTTLEARRIDPRSGAVLARVQLTPLGAGRVVGGLTVGGGAVWVSASRLRWHGGVPHATGTVWRLDPTRARVTARTAVRGGAGALLAAAGSVWVAGMGDGRVSRLDVRTAALTGSVEVGPQPFGLAFAHGAIWITDSRDGRVRRVDTSTAHVTATVRVGRAPYGIAAGARGLWVAVLGDGDLAQIDPATARVVRRIHTGGDPVAVVSGLGYVWVALNSDQVLLRIKG